MRRRLALVGIGKIARDQHIPALANSPSFELAATASRHATVDGITGYTNLAALLEAEPEIDCISLCTPPQPRYADALLALDAGRHVMLEKPPGATLSEVHELAERAAANHVTLYATWHSRQAAAVDAAREWIAGRRLRTVHITWKEDVRQWHPGQDWVWEAGGLGVFDPGINALSILTAILPRAVHLVGARLAFPANRDTPVAAELQFADSLGVDVRAEFDWLEAGPPTWTIDLECEDAVARLSQGGAVFTVDGTTLVEGTDEEYPRLYARFAKLVERAESDVDLAPMRHVADAFTLGRRLTTAPFDW